MERKAQRRRRRSGRRGCVAAAVLLALAAGAGADEAEVFFLYAYHNKPPYYAEFATERNAGKPWLYEDLADYLNERQSAFRVRIKYLPRVRLEKELERGTLKGGIVGVNPLWFRDLERTRFWWTPPFMQDRDVVVVQQGKAFPYEHPRDLIGKQLTLPRGLYWWGVTELILAGKIRAEETDHDVQNLHKVALGRADATITSYLSFQRMMKDHFPQGGLECLPVPHDQYERRILVPLRYEAQYQALAAALDGAQDDPAWRRRLDAYGYAPREEPAGASLPDPPAPAAQPDGESR